MPSVFSSKQHCDAIAANWTGWTVWQVCLWLKRERRPRFCWLFSFRTKGKDGVRFCGLIETAWNWQYSSCFECWMPRRVLLEQCQCLQNDGSEELQGYFKCKSVYESLRIRTARCWTTWELSPWSASTLDSSVLPGPFIRFQQEPRQTLLYTLAAKGWCFVIHASAQQNWYLQHVLLEENSLQLCPGL